MSMENSENSHKNEAAHNDEPLVRFSCLALARIAHDGKYALLPPKAKRSNSPYMPPNRNIRIHPAGHQFLSETFRATFEPDDSRIFTVPQSTALRAHEWFEQRLPEMREIGVEDLVERELIGRHHLFDTTQAEGYSAELAGLGGRLIESPIGSKVPHTLQLFEVHDLTLPDEAIGALLENAASDEPTAHFFTEAEILHRHGRRIDDIAAFLFRYQPQS